MDPSYYTNDELAELARRECQGQTQQSIADALGVLQALISLALHGKKPDTARRILALKGYRIEPGYNRVEPPPARQ